MKQFLITTKFVQNLAVFMFKSALFSRKLASPIGLLTFVFHYTLDLEPNPVLEPECVPVQLMQKLAVSVPMPQHLIPGS
jgi:hypothetical protein